jgi:hypothetical protein
VRRVTLALVVLVAPLGAQSGLSKGGTGAGVGTRARLTGHLPEPALVAIDSVVRAAAAAGLPTEPLVQKALEGAAKHAPPGRIVEAVASQADQLRQARTLLERGDGRPPTATEITSVAAAMVRGLPQALAERIVTALPNEPPGPALHAVADLAGHGFAEDSAVDLIVSAAKAGLRGLRLLDVATAAVHALQRGASHAQALEAVRGALPDVPAPPQPSPAQVNRARRPRPGV